MNPVICALSVVLVTALIAAAVAVCKRYNGFKIHIIIHFFPKDKAE